MTLQTYILKKQNGFTLIEIMIALFVFTIGILAVGIMQLRAIQGNSSGLHLSEAVSEAQEIIERVVQQPFAAFPVGTPAAIVVGPYTITQNISGPPAGSTLTYRRVAINVAWREGDGRQRNVPMTFIKSQNLESSYDPL